MRPSATVRTTETPSGEIAVASLGRALVGRLATPTWHARLKRAIENAFDSLEGRVCAITPQSQPDLTMCCQSCGNDAARGIASKSDIGVAFYHEQDEQDMRRSGGTFITFGALDDSDEGAEHIGQMLVEAFRQENLKVEWNGTAHERILVTL